MSDDLQNYRLQLQQVEAALLSEPTNNELQKLKIDLNEVIGLTLDLKNKADEAAQQPEYTGPVGVPDDDEVTRSLLAVEQFVAQNKRKKIWRVGDTCLAKWHDNAQYYEAHIDQIHADGQVNVTFEAYKNRGVTTLDELREFTGQKRVLTEAERLKRIKMLSNREYLKKKKLKKQQRFKELEEERETEKNKWLAFTMKNSIGAGLGASAPTVSIGSASSSANTSASNAANTAKKVSSLSGMMRNKSIFASPDSVNGRVGIGTCGISGRPMTGFTTAEKWRKGV